MISVSKLGKFHICYRNKSQNLEKNIDMQKKLYLNKTESSSIHILSCISIDQ